jgi:hypothetical protein
MDVALRAGLVEVSGRVPTFASAGLEHRAESIAEIAGSAVEYLAGPLGHRPEIQVLVLSEADWPEKGQVPLFGLPNAENGTLVVAGTEAAWWSDLVALVPDEHQAALATIHAGPDGQLHFDGFFDLVAVHEVAHLFAEGKVAFPRMWLGEFFANLALHAWVARRARDHLDTLTTLPRLAAMSPGETFENRSREAFERFYLDMGGPNYAWYEFRLQVAAAELFEVLGEDALRRLFDAFRVDAEPVRDSQAYEPSIDDTALAARLSTTVDPMLGAFSLTF